MSEKHSNEFEYIFNKRIVCEICNHEFTSKVVKTGKSRFLGTDEDLRPKYSNLDTIKYDVYMCPYCGYAAVAREFTNVTPKQRVLLKNELSNKYAMNYDISQELDYYDYDIAIKRYKMALFIANKKPSKISERAYLCLKLAWLNRSMYEEILEDKNENTLSNEEKERYTKYKKDEQTYLSEAYKGFIEAIGKEYPPICGMDDCTLNYLLSVLSYRNGEKDNALRFGYEVVQSNNATSKLKDKARELLEKVKKQ